MDQNKCVVCGTRRTRSFKISVKTYGLKYEENTLLKWKTECSKSLCEVLFNSYKDSTTSFFEYFQQGNYCPTCQQTVRDFNFSWKQLKSFQSQVDRYSKDICQLIDNNYRSIKSKTNKKIIKQNICKLTDEDSLPHYSSREIVEMIHFMTSERDLIFLPVPLKKQHAVEAEPQSLNFEIKTENSDDDEYSQNQPEFENECVLPESPNFSYNECDNVNDSEEQFDHLGDQSESKSDSDSNQTNISNRKGRAMKKTLRKSSKGNNKRPPKRKPPKTRKNSKDKVHGLSLEDTEIEYIKQMSPTGKLNFVRPTALGLAVYTKLFICTWESIDELNLNEDEKAYVMKMKSMTHKKPNHLRELTSGKYLVFTCSVENCTAVFSKEEKLEAHVREHNGEECVYYCTSCPLKSKDYSQINKHRKKVHNGVKLSHYYFCKICEKSYATENELNEHNTTSHQGPNPFQCAFCEVQFSSSRLLIDHTRKNHSEAPYLSNKCVKTEQCLDCSRRFSNKETLQKHLCVPHDPTKCQNLFKCYVCLKKFNSREELRSHKKVHRYVCEICGKEVGSTGALKKHLDVVHAGILRFNCPVCDRKCKTQSQLIDHERVHSGIRSFLCKVCGKGFITKCILRGHELTHEPGYIPRKPFRRTKQRPRKSPQPGHSKSKDPILTNFSTNEVQLRPQEYSHENIFEIEESGCGTSLVFLSQSNVLPPHF